MNRPVITMFTLMSVDGKISTGFDSSFDFDRDLPNIPGVREGLYQYYNIQQTTDEWFCLSGKTLAKIGANNYLGEYMQKINANIVVFDNRNLTRDGVAYLLVKYNKVVVISKSNDHLNEIMINPDNNAFFYLWDRDQTLRNVLEDLYNQMGVCKMTLEGGGTLNATFLREGVIDFLHIIVAPIAIGGRSTPTLIDGDDLFASEQAAAIKALELVDAKVLNDSYIELTYRSKTAFL